MTDVLERGQERLGPRIAMRTVKEELFRWICEKQAMNSFLDRGLLREKALRLTTSYGLNGFKCSDGWLTHFLREHGFSSNLANQSSANLFNNHRDWIDMMRTTITKYKHSDLFHVDELTMYSDVIPSKILSNGVESSPASNPPKNRVTILLGCSSSGATKLPLLMCGPYLPKTTMKEHDYYHSETSYIGEDLFKNWLTNLNDRMARCNRKILLLLRRNRAHELKDFFASNIQLLYFPKDFPPFLRPLRRDVFHYVKMVFRRKYAERLKQHTSEWNPRDLLSCAIEAWETIPRELIIFSFQRTHFRTDDCFLQIGCDCWDSLKAGISFRRFVTFDDDLSDEQTQDHMDNPYTAYKLQVSCKDVIEIDEDSLQSVRVDTENVGSTRSENLSLEPGWNSSTVSLERRNHIDKKLDSTIATARGRMVNDNDRIASRGRLKKTPIEGNSKRRKSQKRCYRGTEFSTEGQSRNRRTSRDKMIKDAFVPKARTESFLKSIKGKVFKRKAKRKDQPKMNSKRDSLQAFVYAALTLSSSTKSPYAKKLIDSACSSNQENAGNNDRWPRSKQLTDRTDSELSVCANRERVRSEFTDETKRGKNKIESNSPGSFLGKFNLPSTSTNNWNPLPEEIDQSASKETVECRQCKIESPGAPKLYQQNLVPSRNSSPMANLNDEDSSFSVHRESLPFPNRKRFKSQDINDSEDDSDNVEPKRKELKVNYDWSKQFETTFVFGSPNANSSSLVQQQDENIIDSCIFNIRPTISPRD